MKKKFEISFQGVKIVKNLIFQVINSTFFSIHSMAIMITDNSSKFHVISPSRFGEITDQVRANPRKRVLRKTMKNKRTMNNRRTLNETITFFCIFGF